MYSAVGLVESPQRERGPETVRRPARRAAKDAAGGAVGTKMAMGQAMFQPIGPKIFGNQILSTQITTGVVSKAKI